MFWFRPSVPVPECVAIVCPHHLPLSIPSMTTFVCIALFDFRVRSLILWAPVRHCSCSHLYVHMVSLSQALRSMRGPSLCLSLKFAVCSLFVCAYVPTPSPSVSTYFLVPPFRFSPLFQSNPMHAINYFLIPLTLGKHVLRPCLYPSHSRLLGPVTHVRIPFLSVLLRVPIDPL